MLGLRKRRPAAGWIATLIVVAVGLEACRPLAPIVPRFVVVFDQESGTCRINVIRDTRSTSCFVGLRCGRSEATLVLVPADVCTP